jgi:predicted lipoprotein with Yx(FWY)xxD motif
VRTPVRLLLGLTAFGAVALSACSQAAPLLPSVAPPAVAPAPPAVAPAPVAPPVAAPQQQGQGQVQQGQAVTGSSYQSQDQVEASLGRRSSEGGYWPASIQLGGSQLGNILYDGYGFPLYMSTKDSTQPPSSNCGSNCGQFAPVLVNSQITYQNVDPSKIGTYKRSDDTQQLTYYGHPVYRNLQDYNAGQVTGNGENNTWFAITVSGTIAGSR